MRPVSRWSSCPRTPTPRSSAGLARSPAALSRAIAALDEVIRLDPGSFRAYLHRGIANQHEGRYRRPSPTSRPPSGPGPTSPMPTRPAHGPVSTWANFNSPWTTTPRRSSSAPTPGPTSPGAASGTTWAPTTRPSPTSITRSAWAPTTTAHYRRGLTRYIMGDNPKAIEDFARAIRLNSRHAGALPLSRRRLRTPGEILPGRRRPRHLRATEPPARQGRTPIDLDRIPWFGPRRSDFSDASFFFFFFFFFFQRLAR